MRKKDLIEKLQKIDGNPEIVLYNGFVDDWMHIKLEEGSLYKYKCINKEFEGEWNVSPNYYSGKEEFYKRKVIYILGKIRGISTFDRAGDIKY